MEDFNHLITEYLNCQFLIGDTISYKINVINLLLSVLLKKKKKFSPAGHQDQRDLVPKQNPRWKWADFYLIKKKKEGGKVIMGMLVNVLIGSLSFWVLNLMNELINDMLMTCFFVYFILFYLYLILMRSIEMLKKPINLRLILNSVPWFIPKERIAYDQNLH